MKYDTVQKNIRSHDIWIDFISDRQTHAISSLLGHKLIITCKLQVLEIMCVCYTAYISQPDL